MKAPWTDEQVESMTVKEFHTCIDKQIAASGVTKSSCCATCTLATCCHEPVFVGKDEVQWMLDSLTDDQREYVKEMAMEWSVKAVGTGLLNENAPNDLAYRWLPHKIPCPFLKDKKCIAYERRPMSCRMWFARDTPENCDMPGRVHQRFAELPPRDNPEAMNYFKSRLRDGTFHMDQLGVILCELLLGIKIPSASKIIVENMDEQLG